MRQNLNQVYEGLTPAKVSTDGLEFLFWANGENNKLYVRVLELYTDAEIVRIEERKKRHEAEQSRFE